jgi:hypothetical protein
LSIDIDSLDSIVAILDNLASGFSNTIRETGATLSASLLTGLLVNQPFYTFEADWKTYINNVKMMINTAVVMLGLQNAYVRIGNQYMCVGKSATYTGGDDVWTLYRYITPDDDIGTHTSIDNIKGESSQYVSFMIDPSGESESYTNTTAPSQIYSSVINSGSDIGSEVAFITNSSQSAIDDSVIQLAGGAVDTANRILGALAGGVGKFTAAIAAGMARTYTGDHAIYPEIFKEHSSTQTYTIHIKLRASRGDPYTYLMDILVPLFHIMAMALPKMSKNSAASYQYPPLIQCNVPGMWGTRLGIIESLSIQKAPNGEMSVYGYPLSINVDVVIKDLMHAMVTTPMDAPALFLNNTPMFDYIAQCTGVDKYREGLDLTVNTGGLSSLAMYNYLSSNFDRGGVYVYSSGRSPSGYTEKAHYRVNVIGSGIMEVLFFANCLLFILAGVVIGFCYSLMMCISVIKQCCSVLVSIPGALLGVMKSIATVVATVIAMLLEILVSIGLYTAVSELLMAFSAVLEGPLSSAIQNLAAYGAISQPLMISDASYVAHLCVSTVFFGVFGIAAYMFAPKALRIWDKLISVIFMMILGRAPEKKAIKVRERRYAGEPVGAAVYKLFM